jgi:multidrug efflux pump subunit AcrA (membrane-fusion protein)
MKLLQYGLLIILIATLFCQKSDSIAKRDNLKLRIKVTPVERMDMTDTVRIYGKIKLRQEALVASQFDGRLTEFSLLIGDAVRVDEQIGIVIPPAREALLQVLDKVDASLQPFMMQQIKSIPLFCPINGVVLEVMHHSGDVLQKGEPIVYIGDLSRLDVHGDLPVKYLPLISGLKTLDVCFVNYPHPPMTLPIEAVSGKVDENKQTVALRLGLANETGEFKPGMMVQLTVPERSHHAALIIPRSALLEEEGVFSVFVLHRDTVEKRLIQVGIMQDNTIEVTEGLSEGEEVATEKAYSLVDGMEVTAQ